MSIERIEEIVRIEYGEYSVNDKDVLKDLYFYANAGESIGITTKSSTTQNCIIEILSGKSCLKSGTVQMMERTYQLKDMQYKLKKWVAVVSANNGLARNLTVLENFFCTEKAFVFFNKKNYKKKADILLNTFSHEIELEKKVGKLSRADRIIAESYRYFLQGKKVFLFVNIYDYLNTEDVRLIQELFGDLKREGLTVILFDINTEFLKQNSDRVFCVNSGRTIACLEKDEMNRVSLIRAYSESVENNCTCSLDMKKKSDKLFFDRVCFESLEKLEQHVNAGEITIFRCSSEETYRDLYRILFGNEAVRSGCIMLRGHEYKAKGISYAVNSGICCMTENSTDEMLYHNATGYSNCINDIMGADDHFVIDRSYKKVIVSRIGKYLSNDKLEMKVSEMNILDRQKLVFCKLMLHAPSVITAMQPFSYNDDELIKTIKYMLIECAKSGIAIMIITMSKTEYFEEIDGVKVVDRSV